MRIVSHTHGPLLVLAGPGTGKSHTIAARMVRLILDRAAAPSELLALTFSEKAASSMQERVDLNTPMGSNDCTIKTFHAFAHELLQEFAQELGLSSRFRVLKVEMVLMLRMGLASCVYTD